MRLHDGSLCEWPRELNEARADVIRGAVAYYALDVGIKKREVRHGSQMNLTGRQPRGEVIDSDGDSKELLT